jgi:dTDP-4-amino-4,6-dideoxygalactose transaminase
MNSRLDTLQAAILRVKLRHLDRWAEKRRQNAELYRQLFASKKLDHICKLPFTPANCVHVYNQFVVRCPNRDALRQFLQERGVPTDIYYPVPLHLQAAFAYLGYRPGQLPQAETASKEVLALPIYPELKEAQQHMVVNAIADFYGIS